jgi:hypothetical protein
MNDRSHELFNEQLVDVRRIWGERNACRLEIEKIGKTGDSMMLMIR